MQQLYTEGQYNRCPASAEWSKKYQWNSVHKQIRQHFGIDLSLGADVAVPTNLGKHIVLTLTVAREPDLAHAGHASFTNLRISHMIRPVSAKTCLIVPVCICNEQSTARQIQHARCKVLPRVTESKMLAQVEANSSLYAALVSTFARKLTCICAQNAMMACKLDG